jgi:hypothetical protein
VILAGRGEILPLATAHNIQTLANWTRPLDYAAFVFGHEAPRDVRAFLAAFTEATGLNTVGGRLDGLSWDNRIHLELEWLRLSELRVLAPPHATLNGVRLATLPHVRETRFTPPLRHFRWAYSHAAPPLGLGVLFNPPE